MSSDSQRLIYPGKGVDLSSLSQVGFQSGVVVLSQVGE